MNQDFNNNFICQSLIKSYSFSDHLINNMNIIFNRIYSSYTCCLIFRSNSAVRFIVFSLFDFVRHSSHCRRSSDIGDARRRRRLAAYRLQREWTAMGHAAV